MAEVPPAEAPAGASALEERMSRLEEALNHLNERVADLERRVEDAEEQAPVLSGLSGDIHTLLTEGKALCGELKSLTRENAEAPVEAAPAPVELPSAGDVRPEQPQQPEEPDLLGLAFEALERRVSLLEQRPKPVSDSAGIAQDVLALVRVDMEKSLEEQSREVAQLRERVSQLESRPTPQLILPDLPDVDAITEDVMKRLQSELDRVAAESAARVVREEIAALVGK